MEHSKEKSSSSWEHMPQQWHYQDLCASLKLIKRRTLVREAGKRPTATFNKVEELFVSAACIDNNLPHSSYVKVKKNITKIPVKSPKSMWENLLWSDENKVEHFGHNSKRCVWHKPKTAHHQNNTIPAVKDGGRSIMLLAVFSWNWGPSQWGGNYKQIPNTIQCWHRTFRLLVESWR